MSTAIWRRIQLCDLAGALCKYSTMFGVTLKYISYVHLWLIYWRDGEDRAVFVLPYCKLALRVRLRLHLYMHCRTNVNALRRTNSLPSRNFWLTCWDQWTRVQWLRRVWLFAVLYTTNTFTYLCNIAISNEFEEFLRLFRNRPYLLRLRW